MDATSMKLIDDVKQVGNDLTKAIKDKIDYCSGVPEFSIGIPCCKNHDAGYRNKGKFKADWDFAVCIMKKASGYKRLYARFFIRTVGVAYYLGVSIFGWIPYYKAQKENK